MGITLEFCEYGVLVTDTQSNGVVVQKIVDPKEFVAGLSKFNNLSTGLIPPNTKYYMCAEGEEVLYLEYPPSIREVTFTNGDKLNTYVVPVPGLLLILRTARGEDGHYGVYKSKLFAIKRPILSMDDPLFRFPFGNVGADGNICWGRAALPRVQSLLGYNGAIDMFFNSIFNGDLGDNCFLDFTVTNDTGKEDRIFAPEQLLRFLDGKRFFDYDILVSSGTFKQEVGGIV